MGTDLSRSQGESSSFAGLGPGAAERRSRKVRIEGSATVVGVRPRAEIRSPWDELGIGGVGAASAPQRSPHRRDRWPRRAALRLRHRDHRRCPALHQAGLRPRQLRPGGGGRRGPDRSDRRSRDRRAGRRHLRPAADDPAGRRRLHRRRRGQRGGAQRRGAGHRPDRDRRRDRARLRRRPRLHLRGGATREPRPPGQLLPASGDDRHPRRLSDRARLRPQRGLALDARARLRAGAGAGLRDAANAAEPALAGDERRRLRGAGDAGEDPRRRPGHDRPRAGGDQGEPRRQAGGPGASSCSRWSKRRCSSASGWRSCSR